MYKMYHENSKIKSEIKFYDNNPIGLVHIWSFILIIAGVILLGFRFYKKKKKNKHAS